MPKFKKGESPQLTFSKKGGGKYTKTYHSRAAAARAAKAMRKSGAKILKSGTFGGGYQMTTNASYKNYLKRMGQ